MKNGMLITLLILGLAAGGAAGQEQPPAGASRVGTVATKGPPPQAYEDCKGRKAGDIVQHSTPEGKVSATCAESPQGLVARPAQPAAPQQSRAKP